MQQKKYQPLLPLLTSVVFLFLGILFITRFSSLWKFIHGIVVVIFIGQGMVQIVSSFRSKEKKIIISILNAFISLGFGLFIYHNQTLFLAFFQYIFGFWILLNGIIQLLNFYFVYLKDKLKYRYLILIDAIITLFFAAIILIEPLSNFFIVSYLIGGYLIFFSITNLITSIQLLAHNSNAKRSLSIPMPIFIAAFIPNKVFTTINKLFQPEEIHSEPTKNTSKSNVDLEVFLYLKGSGPESFGHCDISFQGKIYSYGCHDPHQRRLFGTLGDGVLVVSDRDAFINHAVFHSKSTVIQFGITLTEEQKELVQQRIQNLLDRSVPFKSDAQLLIEQNQDSLEVKDYLSRVYRATKATSYKFTEGKFKTYFVFTTNCVLLADYILRMPELELFNLSGVLTPGTYFDFLNREFQRGNPVIIEREVYRHD